MKTSSSTQTTRHSFFKNKYIEYRKMYDEARNFSKTLDSAQNVSKSPTPTPSKTHDKVATKGHTVTPYGVQAKDQSTEASFNKTSANLKIPNTGAASDRMLDKVKELESHIRAAANRYELPPELIAGVIWQESRGNPKAVSHCGAMGLMQLMPETAANLGVGNAFDAAQNIDGGAKYLRQMLDKFSGRVDFAVAAYNAGPGNVAKHGGIPPFRETQDYVPKVLGYANSFSVASAFEQRIPSNAVRV